MNIFRLSDKDLGKAFLNMYMYRKSRAESTDPAVLDLAMDIEIAIKKANLTKREHDIIRVHYDIGGGDSISGDREDKQKRTADILGIHVNTVGNNLRTAWEKIGYAYRGVRK